MTQGGLLGPFVLDMAIQLVGFLAASAFKTEKFYDLFGSLSFLTLVWRSLLVGGAALPRHILLTAMVTLWAVRLGTFLVVRVVRTGGDRRFDEALQKPATFFAYWMIQGVWVFVTLLPSMLAMAAPQRSAWLWTDAAGLALWAVGLLTEAVADAQKFAFKMDPKNEGRFITTGLWSLSRHPNYFGEILVWWGTFTVCSSALPAGTAAAASLSPLFVMFLLLRVSGVPILERSADKRWGSEAAYQEYKRRTNCVVPLPGVNFL
uniref:Uncharacterized protein n=1 Tax=Tetraselmis sp. GSL018 TaxID=582737 RepID=A0A061S5I4_9CHLO